MNRPISANDAELALREIALSRDRMHEAIRLHHGHVYLWLWGVITVVNCGGTHLFGVAAMQPTCTLTNLIGIIASFGIGFWRSRRIRVQPDRRFIAVVAMIMILNLFVIPAIVGWPQDPRRIFIYVTLIWTQLYVLAGIWFSNYLVWSGVLCIVFGLLGLFVFLNIFWLWCAVTIGGTLLVSGFYVRYFYK
jgi:hypothetical protein